MRTVCWDNFREDTAMAEDHGRTSRETTEQATEMAEITIFWGAVIAVFVIVIGMIKGIFGY